MLSRIRAWLVAPTHTAPPVAASESHESAGTEREVARDAQLGELATKLATVARAQSKLSLRLDELATQIDSNHTVLLGRLGPAPDDIAAVLDALDRLEDAMRSLTAEQRAVAEGLAGIVVRLERFLAGRGIVRHAPLGAIPDGRRFRVVGTESDHELAEGVVTRVVRSAATRGEQLVREGEVIINRRISS